MVGITTAGLVGRSKVGVGVTGIGDKAGRGVTSIDSGNSSLGSLSRAGAKVAIRATNPITKSKIPMVNTE
jgi:hypothetical protein